MNKIKRFIAALLCAVLCWTLLPEMCVSAASAEEIAAAQQRVEELREQIAEGILGFYRESGTYDEIKTMIDKGNEAAGRTVTDIGNPKDATSIENVLSALDLIIEGNTLRKNDEHRQANPDGQSDVLKVTDYTMALAQIQTNRTAYVWEHWRGLKEAGYFYYTGENIAQASNTSYDPFNAWYTREKAVYDAYLADHPDASAEEIEQNASGQVGHYMNIVNPKNENNTRRSNLTGLGYSQYGSAGNTWAQEFGRTDYPTGNKSKVTPISSWGTAYTPEEYKANVENYVMEMQQRLADAEAELERLQAGGDEPPVEPDDPVEPDHPDIFRFTDVRDENLYYYAPVYWAVERSITSGYTDKNGEPTGEFGPDDECTRAQIVTFLYRAAGSPAVDTANAPKFKDVKKSAYYYKAVIWAAQNKITTGYTDKKGNPTGYFGSDDKCTRGQVVTFLYRAAGEPAIDTSALPKFKDVKKSDFFYKAVVWAAQSEITTGYSKTKFAPNDICTRGQVVTFLYRKEHAASPDAGTSKTNAYGQKLIALGYGGSNGGCPQIICFCPDWKDSDHVLNRPAYEDFDFSMLVTDFDTYMDSPSPALEGKTRRQDTMQTWYGTAFFDKDGFMTYNGLETMGTYRVVSEGYEYSANHRTVTVTTGKQIYNAERSYSGVYDAEKDQYVFETVCGQVRLDCRLPLPVMTIVSSAYGLMDPQEIDPVGLEYDADGRLTKIIYGESALSAVYSLEYDSDGRLIHVVSGGGAYCLREQDYFYNEQGLLYGVVLSETGQTGVKKVDTVQYFIYE